jgi:DUF438 domain-containing protein
MSELLDNSRHRIETLKGIIRKLHDGADPTELTAEFGDLLAEVGPTEIAAMENSLMADGMAQEEIQRMCDVHASVLAGPAPHAPVDVPRGHPVHTFRLENERIREICGSYRGVAEKNPIPVEAWRQAHEELGGLETHYLRKEYLVFPFLEKAASPALRKSCGGCTTRSAERLRLHQSCSRARPRSTTTAWRWLYKR